MTVDCRGGRRGDSLPNGQDREPGGRIPCATTPRPNVRLSRLTARIVRFCLSAAFYSVLVSGALAQNPQYDLVIIGGHILDGTGGPWFEGSVAVKDGKIADIGRLGKVSARRVIDASGLVVAPGFIDLHSHSDYTLLVDGKAESKIRQGVTAEILGESGSAGPVVGRGASGRNAYLARLGIASRWTTLGGYFSRIAQHRVSVNIASYVGSGQVRMNVMGNVNREPTPAELARMKQLVEEAMKDGAIGLSSGLIYPPNAFAKTDELVELAKVSAAYGGIYTSHIRSEGNEAVQAVDEAISIGERAHIPVHILHFKIAGRANWGGIRKLIERVEAARERGVEVTADAYPYIASATGLQMVLPTKYLEGTAREVVARLKDPKVRDAIRKQLKSGESSRVDTSLGDEAAWNGVMVSSVRRAENKKYEGKRMDEIGRATGKDPFDALCDLLISEGGSAGAIYFQMSEPDVRLAIEQPWVGIGSDGTAVNPTMKFIGKPHPRYFGTFPRVLGVYVREEKVLTLAEAVRKMTSFPAEVLGLTDRGVLRPGMAADITVFDPKTVRDKATFEDPMQYPVGIPFVIVNGVVVIDKDRHTGSKPGRVLYGRGKHM